VYTVESGPASEDIAGTTPGNPGYTVHPPLGATSHARPAPRCPEQRAPRGLKRHSLSLFGQAPHGTVRLQENKRWLSSGPFMRCLYSSCATSSKYYPVHVSLFRSAVGLRDSRCKGD